jgi:hypothetical protein
MTPGTRTSRTALAGLIVLPLSAGLSSCLDDCGGGIASCALDYAVTVMVTEQATGRPVADVTIDVGGFGSAVPCRVEGAATVCRVIGSFGTYQLAVGAPGFQPERRTVIVGGEIGECGCPIVDGQTVQVRLVALP